MAKKEEENLYYIRSKYPIGRLIQKRRENLDGWDFVLFFMSKI